VDPGEIMAEKTTDTNAALAVISATLENVDEKVDRMEGKIDALRDTIGKHSEAITVIQTTCRGRGTVFKWLAGLVVAVAGALVGWISSR